MSSRALSWRMLLWTAFVVFCTLGLAYLPFAYLKLPVVGHVTYYEVLLLGAALLGSRTLIRVAGDPEPSAVRTMCRILVAYLLFELLVVIPVAVWLGAATVTATLDTMAVRFTWLLFPVVLTLCADERGRWTAGAVPVIAAVGLAAWGVYLAATGGAGYYLEDGYLRYRVLYGSSTLLFAWPFVLAVSQAVSRRWYTAALLGVSLVGLTLTNHRSGLIAFAVGGLACVAMSGQIRRLLPWIVPVALIVAVTALLWGQQASGVFGYTLSHLLDVSAGNGADRLMRWRLAWDFFASRPFNDYVWSWRYYLVYLKDAYQPHNFALEIAVTEGVVGLVLYGSLLATALKGAWSFGRRDVETQALVAYLIVYLVFCLGNTSWYALVSIPLFIAAVAALAARVGQLRAAETFGLPNGGVGE